MSRVSKVLLLLFVVVFVLACNFITRPIDQAQEAVETVQSLATAIPVETLRALPSVMPDIEMPTGMPDIGGVTDPQGEPLSEWNGIPIMPSATSGGESAGIYSFKADATVTEVFDYYKTELVNLGWAELFAMADTGSGALLTYEMGDHLVTITITTDGDGALVFLTYQ